MEEIPCIFCKKLSSHIVLTENGYNGLKCHNCNLIYISPRPSASETTRLYTDDNAVLDADVQLHFERPQRKNAARVLSKLRRYKNTGSILEIGPGGGFFLLEAQRYGYEPFAIELNPIEARWINEKLRIPCESAVLHEGSFAGKKFDIIYHKDVLSHLYDPVQAFREMNRSLKDGGLLVFETGNIADVNLKYYKYFAQFSYPDHLFFFGEKSLQLLLGETGFKSVCVYRDGILPQLVLQRALWRFKDPLKEKKVLQDMESGKEFDSARKGFRLKKRLRVLYRNMQQLLLKIGTILPKEGRPLKLLVMACKRENIEMFSSLD
jgi:SAM-dependent methyltransferase